MDICGTFGCIFEPKLLTFALTLPAFGLSRPGPVHRVWSGVVLYGWSISLLLALFFFRVDDLLLAEALKDFVFPALVLHIILHELSHALYRCTMTCFVAAIVVLDDPSAALSWCLRAERYNEGISRNSALWCDRLYGETGLHAALVRQLNKEQE